MAIATLERMVLAEKRSLKEHSIPAADIVARYLIVGPDFLNEVYYPTGGLEAFYRTSPRRIYRQAVGTHGKSLKTLILAMKLFHFASQGFEPKNISDKPSLNKAIAVMSDLKKARPKNDVLKDRAFLKHWASHKETLALAYAASTIQMNGEGTILEKIVEAKAWNYPGTNLMREWFGRARYVCDNVLSNLYESGVAEKNSALLPIVESIYFQAPILEGLELELVRKYFGRVSGSWEWYESGPCICISKIQNFGDASASLNLPALTRRRPRMNHDIVPGRSPPRRLPEEGFVRLLSILAPDGPIPVSRSTWWAGVRAGRFPAPVKLSPRVTAWRCADIHELIGKLGGR